MALFRRRKPEPRPEDPDLPLDVDQAARLRALVRATFAEAGREVVVHRDHVEDDQGSRYGLWNVAAVCNDAPESDWPELVGRHVRLLLQPDELDDVSEAELRASTYTRLVEAAQIPDATWHPTAPRLGEDVLVVLAVDRPEQVTTPQESFWEERGGVEHWREVGRSNLRALLDSTELQHERIEPRDGVGGFDVLLGESFFTGSLALLVEEVAARFGATQAEHGLLVCVPFRHQLAWTAVLPGRDAALALDNLFGFAAAGFSDAPGPVSPHVYWVSGGRWTQLTRVDADGLGVIHVEDDLARLLGLTED